MLIKTYHLPKALMKEVVTDKQHWRGDRKLENFPLPQTLEHELQVYNN